MRYVITESFDRSEINHYFLSDVITPAIGTTIKTRGGRWYRVEDVSFTIDDIGDDHDVRVLIKRLK